MKDIFNNFWKKRLLAFLGMISPTLLQIIVIFLAVAVILAPIMAAVEAVSNFVNSIFGSDAQKTEMYKSVGDALGLKEGDVNKLEAASKDLKAISDNYAKNGVALDNALIIATIYYPMSKSLTGDLDKSKLQDLAAHQVTRAGEASYSCEEIKDSNPPQYQKGSVIASTVYDESSQLYPVTESALTNQECTSNLNITSYSYEVDDDKYEDYLTKDGGYFDNNSDTYGIEAKSSSDKEKIMSDIEGLKSFVSQFFGLSGANMYIPGLSSLPIQIGSGDDWRENISRGFNMLTAVCYEQGSEVLNPDGSIKSDCAHNGIDFAYPMGTPVHAIANGKVMVANSSIDPARGKYIEIGHDTDGDGTYNYYSLYLHLSEVNVNNDAMVGGGQVIGKVGSTGNSSGPHLHFELRDKSNTPIDPDPILAAIASRSADNPFAGYMACNLFPPDKLAQINDNLTNLVNKAGKGTREGVVAAAKFLSQELGVKIPYFWGGKYYNKGISGSWGCSNKIAAASGGVQGQGEYFPDGIDCSGFTSWSMINGGYKVSNVSSREWDASYGEHVGWAEGFNLAKPGDLAKKPGHVAMIIGLDRNTSSYIVAEERGYPDGLVVNVYPAASGGFTEVVLMDDFYNNAANKEE